MSLPSTVVFEGVELTIIDRAGKPWITQNDLARALYGVKGGGQVGPSLEQAVRTIRRLLDRNRDEFTDEMTALLTMETSGGAQQVRIFSARGARLMGLFAKTLRAKAFRVWVLDVLEGKVSRRAKADDETLREVKVRTAAMNAVKGMTGEIRRTLGPPAARKAAPQLLSSIGVILTADDIRPEQGEFELEPDDPEDKSGGNVVDLVPA